MKLILFLLFSIFSFGVTAQNQLDAKKLVGKTIYCFKTINKGNIEGDLSSFGEPNSYPYLFKINLQKDATYRTTNKLREPLEGGKYKVTQKSINLTTSGAGSKIHYDIVFQGDRYVTLKLGDTLCYCLVD